MESYEAEELGSYTSLSTMAVCALLLGLLSPLALLAPQFVVVAIAAIILAVFALARIHSAAGVLSGHNLAYCGLALGIACAVAAPLRIKVRDTLYERQADQAAREWLQFVSQDQVQTALERITGNARMSLSGPPPAEGPPPILDPQILAAKLSQDNLVAKLQAEARHGDLKFAVRSMLSDATRSPPRTAIKYQTVEPDDSLTLNLVLLRSSQEKSWFVDSWNLEGESAHNHPH